MNYSLVTNQKQLDAMCNSLVEGSKIIGLDTETTAFEPRHGKLRLIQLKPQNGPIYVVDCFSFDNYSQLEKLARLFEDKSIRYIIHNASFEYKWLLNTFGVRLATFFDTMLADTLLNFRERHKLSSVTNRLLGIDLDKTEQSSDWSGILTESQLEYAALDVEHLHQLREIQIAQLQETAQLGAAKLEFDAVPFISEMELRGFPVNVERFTRLIEKNESDLEKNSKKLLEFLQTRGGKRALPSSILQEDIFGTAFNVKTENDINISSWQQVLPIYQELGVPITSTDQKVLKPMLAEYPELQYLIDYKKTAKLCEAFGKSFLDLVENGRVYSSFRQMGAITSRMSSTAPNLQNLPRLAEFRAAFMPIAGRKFCIADYSTFELRILAELANDQVMIDAFNSGKDLHSLTAATVFGLPYDEIKSKYKEQRQAAKTGNFSIVYGISPPALTARLRGDGLYDADDDLSKRIIDGFYDTYPDAGRWLFAQERRILKERIVRGAAGHLIKVDFVRGDRKSERSAGRDARNYPIQQCVDGDSKLLLKDRGLVSIKELAGQSNLEIWDGSSFVNAKGIVSSGVKDVYQITLMNNTTVRCSAEHRFLTVDSHGSERWLTAEQIFNLKQIYIKLSNPHEYEDKDVRPYIEQLEYSAKSVKDTSLSLIKDDFDLGFFLGRVASDGGIHNNTVQLRGAEHELSVLHRLESIASVFGDHKFVVCNSKDFDPDKNQNVYTMNICTTKMYGQLLALNIKTDVPAICWQNSSVMRGYLSGMFDGDGTVNNDNIVLVNGGDIDLKERCFRNIQLALLSLGIRSRIRTYRNCSKKQGNRVVIAVLKRDSKRFADLIGFANPLKQGKIPKIISTHKYKKREGAIYGFAERVRSVIRGGTCEMYDVVDTDTHRFAVNGMISHNCNAVALKLAGTNIHRELISKNINNAWIVNVVHDEVIAESDEKDAPEVAEIVERNMQLAGQTFLKKVKIEAESGICNDWSEK